MPHDVEYLWGRATRPRRFCAADGANPIHRLQWLYGERLRCWRFVGEERWRDATVLCPPPPAPVAVIPNAAGLFGQIGELIDAAVEQRAHAERSVRRAQRRAREARRRKTRQESQIKSLAAV